ncbi:7786_t:CDS:2 [Ambispora gerdemannii]|uniref:GPI inositol-deacylase n=1 Tax=Ambispora gerdemannii TaxID=144530 RepID=A0A9N8YM82_9GLOM|nr:7786_t:CDS:2 [Ambispora gerdemannii]
MGVRDADECETFEISSTRYELEASPTLDFISAIDATTNRQQSRERTSPPTTPTSLEKTSLLSNNININHSLPPSKRKSYQNQKSPSHNSLIRNASASLSCSISIYIIFIITVILLGATLNSFLNYQKDSKGCLVSYMRPSFIKQNGFDSEQTRFAGKYSLYLYRESGLDLSEEPTGIPTLFIPGNAGSYKQVRSIAAETAVLYHESMSKEPKHWEQGVRGMDFFSVDFNEEFSAFHGHSLLEQAEYLNDAIRYILSLYPVVRKHQYSHPSQPHPDPASVIIIGHSMGGVVARTLFTMPNYQPGSINTILTMATPHLLPPAPFDWQISKIYTDINEFWRNGYSSNAPPSNSLLEVTLISIAGGTLDTIVCSDSANINSLVPASHGFTVFTTSIPTVWTSMDHQCILWCNQFVKVVARTLLNIVDIRRASQTKAVSERMSVFRKLLLTGFEVEFPEIEASKKKREPFGIISLAKDSNTFLDMGQRLVLKKLGSTPKVHLMPIPPAAPHSTLNTFSLLTDQSLGKDSLVDVLLCDIMPTEVPESIKNNSSANNIALPTDPRLSCHIASGDSIVVPASGKDDREPFSGRTFSFLKLRVKDLGDYQYIAIIDQDGKGIDGFLLAEFYDEHSTITSLDTSIKELFMEGIHVDAISENHSLVSALRIPIIDSSLLTYKMSINRHGCSDGLFAQFVRQSISSMYESKFLVNVKHADVNIHGQAPFVTPVSAPHLRRGLELQFWMDPTCHSALSLDIEFDLYGSLGKIVMRFQTVLVAFPFMVVILTLRAQLREYNRGEPFFSFGHALSLFISQTMPVFLLMISCLSIYQSVTRASKTYSLADLFPVDTTPGDMHKVIKAKASFNVNDTLLGNHDPFFWFLPPLFFLMSVGITAFCYALLSIIVRLLARIALFISQRRPSVARFVGRSQESKTSRTRRRIITTIILFILVASFVPYQFAFVVAFLVHIVSCVRSLVEVRLMSKQSKSAGIQKRWDHYHYRQSILMLLFMLLPFNFPVLMVWIRNLSVHWFVPFSSDHNLFAIAPIIFYVEIITSGKMLPRTTR